MKFIKGIFLLLNIIVIILTLLSYLSPFVDPSRLWIFSFFGLIFPPLLFANIFFIFFWLFFDKKRVLFSLVVLIVGYSHIKKTISFHPGNDSAQAKGISVLSYNMNQGSYLYHNKIKRGLFGKYIKELDADLVLAQEMNSSLIRKEMKDIRVYPYQFTEKNIGTGIYSKYPIVNSGRIDFQLYTNSCVWADVAINKDTFRVYSVHFMSNQISKQTTDIAKDFGNEEDLDTKKVRVVLSRYKKYVQVRARQVKKVKNHINNSPYPVILGGDFNDPSLSYTYQQLSGILKDAFVEKGFGLGVSYGGVIPLLRIDNILVSRNIEVLTFDKMNGKFSDHFAIKAKLKR